MTRLRMPNLEKYLELSDEERERVDWTIVMGGVPMIEYYKWALEQRDKQQLSELGKI